MSERKQWKSGSDFIWRNFLQGFEALDWKYETDQHMALSVSDSNIQTIQKAAEENALAVSFGFLEKAENKIYSSQLTIGADGNILNLFRRVSKGWRESFTDEHYAEGDMFTKFEYLGNTFSIGLCGDLWDEKNVMQIKRELLYFNQMTVIRHMLYAMIRLCF